jgi:competence protein ComEC
LSVQSLCAVVVSHLHADHYGGIEESLERLMPTPEHLWLGVAFAEGRSTPSAGRAVLSLLNRIAKQRGISRSIGRKGHTLTCGRMHIEVLAPDDLALLESVASGNPNWSSLIVKAELDGFQAVLGADAPPGLWRRLIDEEVDLTADVLLIPHHGADFSAAELTRLLEAVSPAVIGQSVGSVNPYDHPRSGTLEVVGSYVRAIQGYLLCTQLNRHCAGKLVSPDTACAGTISVSADAGGLRVTTSTLSHRVFVAKQPSPHCV